MLLAHVQSENDAEGGVCLARHSEKRPFQHTAGSAARSWVFIYTHDLGVTHTTL